MNNETTLENQYDVKKLHNCRFPILFKISPAYYLYFSQLERKCIDFYIETKIFQEFFLFI